MSRSQGPIECSIIAIEDGWIDYNGHLNTGFYNVIFDKVLDEAFQGTGLGPDYIKERNLSWMTLETHVCYLREVLKTDPVRVLVRVLDVDDKRLHTYSELVHAEEGWVAATSEAMHIHVDMNIRKSAPWPADVRSKLDGLLRAHRDLPAADRAGRKIGIVRKG
jgi:acyl-CoA thioester hydrolase